MPFQASCALVTITSRELCIRMPVGQELCVQLPDVGVADPSELGIGMMAQLNSALTPLAPIFNIIDVALAIFHCIKAIPKAIATLNPKLLVDCVDALALAVDKLIQLIPQLSIPLMIVDAIDVLIVYLTGFKRQLEALAAKEARLLQAATKGAEPGQFALAGHVECVEANFDVDIENLNEQTAPVNRLIGLLNAFLSIISAGKLKLPCIGTVGNISAALVGIDLLIEVLQTIRDVIPVPQLPDFGPTGGGSGGVCD